MKCQQVKRQFSKFRDNMLSLAVKCLVEEHLKQCLACAKAWHCYNQVLGCVRRNQLEKVPVTAWVHFKMRLEREQETSRWWHEEAHRLRWFGASAVAVATLLLLLNWSVWQQEEESLAAQNFLTQSQFGKVLVVF